MRLLPLPEICRRMVWRIVPREKSRLLGGRHLYLLSCILFLGSILFARGTVPELSGRANAFDYQSESAWGNVQTDSSGKSVTIKVNMESLSE